MFYQIMTLLFYVIFPPKDQNPRVGGKIDKFKHTFIMLLKKYKHERDEEKIQLKEQIINYRKLMHASFIPNLFLPMLHEKETKYEDLFEDDWRGLMIWSRVQDIEGKPSKYFLSKEISHNAKKEIRFFFHKLMIK